MREAPVEVFFFFLPFPSLRTAGLLGRSIWHPRFDDAFALISMRCVQGTEVSAAGLGRTRGGTT
jgi:hypothetical protein